MSRACSAFTLVTSHTPPKTEDVTSLPRLFLYYRCLCFEAGASIVWVSKQYQQPLGVGLLAPGTGSAVEPNETQGKQL